METGKVIVFAAPSGSGKTSIVKFLLAQSLNLQFSVSATTRQMRSNERDGHDYFFLTEHQFKEKINQNQFIEWEEVYPSIFYGTLKNEVDKRLLEGQNIIFDVDVQGAIHIKKIYENQALALFVKPPTIEDLKNRLELRGTETSETLEARISKATYELSFEEKFDITIININLEEAQQEALQIVKNFIN